MRTRPADDWWRSAVVYQVYPRSFADADGDGTGDVNGIRARLPYLAELGVDAIWISPWYPSPLLDGGYDVADYRDINPEFGTLADADALITEAHALGMRILIDLVPNHCSWEHPWFKAALAAGKGSPERDLFWFRDSEDGPAADELAGRVRWRRLAADQEIRGRTVVPAPVRHLPARLELGQPEGDRGVRLDPAVLVRPRHRRVPDRRRRLDGEGPGVARRTAAQRGADAGEVRRQPVLRPARRAHHPPALARDRRRVRRYAARARGSSWRRRGCRRPSGWRSTSGRTNCTPPSTSTPCGAAWDAKELREVIDHTTENLWAVGAPATWVLSNHDTIRHRTRYGRDRKDALEGAGVVPTDLELGPAPGTGRRAAGTGAARWRVHLPGRRARAARGRGPA